MKVEFRNEEEAVSLKIYDNIDSEYGINTSLIEDSLNEANGKPLNIYINSYGGEVFEGFAIYNMIKRYNGYKVVYIDGLAASIASVIAMSGDRVVMNNASMMMIHNASGSCYGNAEEMMKVVKALEQINEVIRDVYKARTNLDEETISNLMDKETFMTAQECLDYGFADEIIEDKKKPKKCSAEEEIENLKKDITELKDLLTECQASVKNVCDEHDVVNKKSHWDWLRKE